MSTVDGKSGSEFVIFLI